MVEGFLFNMEGLSSLTRVNAETKMPEPPGDLRILPCEVNMPLTT